MATASRTSSALAKMFSKSWTKSGGTADELAQFARNCTLLSQVQSVVRGDSDLRLEPVYWIDCDEPSPIPSMCLAHGKLVVARHRRMGMLKWEPDRFRLVRFPGDGFHRSELGSIVRAFARRRVVNGNILNFLQQHKQLMPKEWEEKDIYFFGTIYKDREGVEGVRFWRDDHVYALALDEEEVFDEAYVLVIK